MRSALLAGGLIACLAAPAWAQRVDAGMHIDAGVAVLGKGVASGARIGEPPVALRAGPDIRFLGLFSVSAGMGAVFLRDDDPFSQSTTDGLKNSTTGALAWFVQGGLLHEFRLRGGRGDGFAHSVAVGLHAGYLALDATRHIPRCLDCTVEDLNIRAGTYLQPTALIAVSRHFALGVSYNRYQADRDVVSDVLLTMRRRFAR